MSLLGRSDQFFWGFLNCLCIEGLNLLRVGRTQLSGFGWLLLSKWLGLTTRLADFYFAKNVSQTPGAADFWPFFLLFAPLQANRCVLLPWFCGLYNDLVLIGACKANWPWIKQGTPKLINAINVLQNSFSPKSLPLWPPNTPASSCLRRGVSAPPVELGRQVMIQKRVKGEPVQFPPGSPRELRGKKASAGFSLDASSRKTRK